MHPSSSSPPSITPRYPVSIWEGIAITAGAVLLVGIGLVRLVGEAVSVVFDSQRVEAIARSMVDYEVPGGSKGVYGLNMGGGKIAVITSTTAPKGWTNPPDTAPPPPAIELLVVRVPISQETEEGTPDSEVANEFFTGFSYSYQVEGAFEVSESRTEQKAFCGRIAPVSVENGWLSMPDGRQLPAVQYDINVERDSYRYIAILSAVGSNAPDIASTVFDSVRCLDASPGQTP